MMGVRLHVELCEGVHDARMPLVTWDMGNAQRKFDVFICRGSWNQRKALENKPNPLPNCPACVIRNTRNSHIVNKYFATVWSIECANHVEQSGFAAPTRSHQRNQLPISDLQVDIR